MRKNVIFELTQTISTTLSKDEILQELNSGLNSMQNIYSYLVYTNYKQGILTSWTIKYAVNEITKYNTLQKASVVAQIYEMICTDKQTTKRIVGYQQPSFEIMLELYTPLIRRLAKQQCLEWPILEYEDAVSICQLSMLKLYRKGYYLHKSLLEKTFRNDVLLSLRKFKAVTEIVSLDEITHDSLDGDKRLSLIDMLADTQLELEKEEQEKQEHIKYVFDKIKDFIVDMIGERQFEQLYRDYANKHTTSWSRKIMQKIKNEINRLGIDKNTFGGI